MKKTFKGMVAAVMAVFVVVLSIVTAFAVEYDPIQNVTYSYSEKGDCTVDYGDVIWESNAQANNYRFTVNGRIATCTWSTNYPPEKGTYTNVTKYYLNNSALRAKAFYWLYLENDASIGSQSAKYDSSSVTYWDDICSALEDADATGAYSFVHSVLNYLQQGEVNPYCDDLWNEVVVDFVDHIDHYPDVPQEYRIFYAYPEGEEAQSLMSWEESPHGYIKVVKSSSDTSVTDGNSAYTFKNIEYYVSKNSSDFDTNGSNYLGYIKLNEDGMGHSKDGSRATLRFLPPGTYYVKEGYIPNGCGYERNDTVYSVTVTKSHTTTAPFVLTVSDTPKTVYGKIVKTSSNPALTDGNPDYSFEGIRYLFSKSPTDFSAQSSNYLGYVALDRNGVAFTANGSRNTLKKLAPGTYYVKESYIPSGCNYEPDNTVYAMTFTFDNDRNNLAVLNVCDDPVLNEQPIPVISITGTKTWDDDNNSDGKRPKSVTVQLYRDDIRIDSFTMSESNGWQYEFNNLEKGYADNDHGGGFHEYRYDVRENNVEYYTSESDGNKQDPSDANHYICDFINHYVSDKLTVSGVKAWDDYNDCMGYRPDKIKVILYRDGVKVDERIADKNNGWTYSFNDLNRYHDGGAVYTYTIGEEPVPGYMVKVNGFDLKNTVNKGSVSLFKGDKNNLPLEGVTFKLFTSAGKAVASVTNGTVYKFWELTEDEDSAVYTTDSNGKIHIDDLPYGNYYFEETKTLLGYIPYSEKIRFEIADSGEPQEVTVDVENAKMIMPNTGGTGVSYIYMVSVILAGIGLAISCLYYHKKSIMKGHN